MSFHFGRSQEDVLNNEECIILLFCLFILFGRLLSCTLRQSQCEEVPDYSFWQETEF